MLLKAEKIESIPENYLPEDNEFEIIKTLADFSKTLKESAEKYEPCYITRYAVDLAQKFNKFYIENKILTAEGDTKKFRIALTSATLQTLKNALSILGIGVPDKM